MRTFCGRFSHRSDPVRGSKVGTGFMTTTSTSISDELSAVGSASLARDSSPEGFAAARSERAIKSAEFKVRSSATFDFKIETPRLDGKADEIPRIAIATPVPTKRRRPSPLSRVRAPKLWKVDDRNFLVTMCRIVRVVVMGLGQIAQDRAILFRCR